MVLTLTQIHDSSMDVNLLTSKELAALLQRRVSYVYAMRRDGFSMPGRRTTKVEAIAWLAQHPEFRVKPRKPSDDTKS